MPFTVSHIVAALPLNNKLGKYSKYTALSPLIIGSMTPDIAYITPFLVHQRMDSHSLIGLYLFCIPMGLTIYFLYHLLMAPVVVSFFPEKIKRLVHPDLFIGKLPSISSHVLIISLVLGAITHIIWDFFTHESGIPQYLTWMNTPLLTIDGYELMSFRVLQHLSSIIGLGILIFIIFRWYKMAIPLSKHQAYWKVSKRLKLFSLITLITVSIIAGCINGYASLPDNNVLYGVYNLQVFVKYALVAAMGAILFTCIGLGLLYQISIRRKKQF